MSPPLTKSPGVAIPDGNTHFRTTHSAQCAVFSDVPAPRLRPLRYVRTERATRGVVPSRRAGGSAVKDCHCIEVSPSQFVHEQDVMLSNSLPTRSTTGTPSARISSPLGHPRFRAAAEFLTAASTRGPFAHRISRDARFHNTRAPQIRLAGSDADRLLELDQRVRNLFVQGVDGAGPKPVRPGRRQTRTCRPERRRRIPTRVRRSGGGWSRWGRRNCPALVSTQTRRRARQDRSVPDFRSACRLQVRIAPSEMTASECEAVRADDVDINS